MKKVCCCNCRKEIGVMIPEGGMNSPIGYIPSYSQKLDYRKASHIWIDSRKDQFGRGNLCKACAKKAFPEGKAYMVMHHFNSKEFSLYAGKNGYGDYFTTKAAAQAVIEDREHRYGMLSHRLVEVEL